MKSFIRNIVINSFALFILNQLLAGVEIRGGLKTFILGGVALSIMTFFLRPFLTIITLPLNALTLGTFSSVTNALILYLLTVFVSDISIHSFTFQGAKYAGFVLPQISLNTFFAFIVSSMILSVIVSFLQWIRS